jgi:hypothetical protein
VYGLLELIGVHNIPEKDEFTEFFESIKGLSMVPSLVMSLLSCRLFVLWLLNVLLMVCVTLATVLQSKDKDKASVDLQVTIQSLISHTAVHQVSVTYFQRVMQWLFATLKTLNKQKLTKVGMIEEHSFSKLVRYSYACLTGWMLSDIPAASAQLVAGTRAHM